LNSNQTMPNPLMRATPAGDQLDFGKANTAPYPVRSKESFIQWPSERDIEAVSTRLARIVQVGIRSEANGDYFKSGDLAYQIHEIIRATLELFKKSQRATG
jgi:hypothetical protein